MSNLLTQQSNLDITTPLKPAALKGISNGTFGLGMSGGLFPSFMGGPFGYDGHPLPNNQEKMAMYDNPKYNSKLGQFPEYNENTFIAKSRFAYVPVYGTDYGPNGLTNIPVSATFVPKYKQ